MNQTLHRTPLTSDPAKVRFHIFDVHEDQIGDEAYIERHNCTDDNAAERISRRDAAVRARIISIRADASLLPLNISQRWMSQVFTEYNVEPEFWDVINRFADAPHPAEGGCTQMFARKYDNGVQACCYDIQYIDDNGRGGRGPQANPWSQRHTGIYHQRVPADLANNQNQFDFVIALHPSQGTNFARKLYEVSRDSAKPQSPLGPSELMVAQMIHQDPSVIHRILLETLQSTWTAYLQSVGDGFLRRSEVLYTIEPDDDEFLQFSRVQEFRHLRDLLLTATAFCRGNQSIIALLKDNKLTTRPELADRAASLLSGLDAFQARVENSIALLEYSVGLRQQEVAKQFNRQMEKLTIFTVILGLLYVPGTFVSGLFGMNFFNYDNESNTLVIASNIWIFVVILIVFTGLTYSLWILANRRMQGNRKPTASSQIDMTNCGFWQKKMGFMPFCKTWQVSGRCSRICRHQEPAIKVDLEMGPVPEKKILVV